jgi:rhodanese-related sulfurtransferase
MTMANTSRHLQVLRQANLVSTRRQGIQVWYRVADAAVVDGYRSLRAMTEARIGEVSALAEAFFGHVDGAEPVGIAELVERSDSGGVVVVDVRPRLEFEAGHLPGAINIPLEELSSRIDELDHSATVVAYCRGPYCVLSAQAVSQLRHAGLDAHRLDAGPLEWDAAGLPLALGA